MRIRRVQNAGTAPTNRPNDRSHLTETLTQRKVGQAWVQFESRDDCGVPLQMPQLGAAMPASRHGPLLWRQSLAGHRGNRLPRAVHMPYRPWR